MKQISVSIAVLLLINQLLFGQNRQVNDYAHLSKISVQKNIISVSVDSVSESFFAAMKQTILHLDSKDSFAFMQLLNLNASQVKSLNEQYEKEFPRLSIADQLINRAKKIGTITLTDSMNTRSTHFDNDVQLEDYNEVKKESKSINWISYWPWLLSIIGAIGIGAFIQKTKEKKEKSQTNINLDELPKIKEEDNYISTENNKESTSSLKAKIKQLEIQNEKSTKQLTIIDQLLLEEKKINAQLESKHKVEIELNKTYFEKVISEIITPYHIAFENGNESEMVRLAFIATAHFMSYARNQVNLGQGFDLYNKSVLLGEKTNLQMKSILSSTFKDEIPNSIQALIHIMEKHSISSFEKTSFLGYTINRQ